MKQIILKRNKNIFWFFGPDKDWPWSYVFSFKVKNQGYVVLERYLENNWENDLIFWKWTWQGLALLLRISRWRIKDHVVLKKIYLFKNVDVFIFWNFIFFFLYFWITWKHVSYDASGQTNIKREIKLFLVFLKMSVIRWERPDRH